MRFKCKKIQQSTLRAKFMNGKQKRELNENKWSIFEFQSKRRELKPRLKDHLWYVYLVIENLPQEQQNLLPLMEIDFTIPEIIFLFTVYRARACKKKKNKIKYSAFFYLRLRAEKLNISQNIYAAEVILLSSVASVFHV